MILKEEEARKKWCPFTRVIGEKSGKTLDQTSYNRVGRSDNETCASPIAANCIATDCMMWRRLGQSSGCCGLAHPDA